MTLHLLEIFLAVCRTLSMTGAADLLGMTQPAVSRAISDLEAYYGTALFERIGRKLYLTAAGSTLREYASSILSECEDVRKLLREESFPSSCRLGATVMAADTVLTDLCLYLQKEIPGIRLQVSVFNASVIADMLRHNECDMALTDRIDDPAFVSEPFMKQSLSFYVSDALYAQREITADQLIRQQLLLRENGSGASAVVTPFLKASGCALSSCWRCAGNDLLYELAEAGMGFAFLPDAYVRRRKSFVLHRVAVDDTAFERVVYLVRLNQKYLTRQLRACYEKIHAFSSLKKA